MTNYPTGPDHAQSAVNCSCRIRFKLSLVVLVILAGGTLVRFMMNPNLFRDIYEGYRIAIGNPVELQPIQRDVVYRKDGKTWLWAGDRPDQRFDITEFQLNPTYLHYGLGREYFFAPTEPKFVTPAEADNWMMDPTPVLLAEVGDEVKVYPIPVVRQFEVVNDEIGGKPVFAAFCVLANLGALYDRQYGDQTLTFAVSGYTYHDDSVWDGKDAFVLWDRDTESLWWPPVGKAVSGALTDAPMKLLDESLWSQTTYLKVKKKYPEGNFLVLNQAQPFTQPEIQRNESLSAEDLKGNTNEDTESIAPRWGENEG